MSFLVHPVAIHYKRAYYSGTPLIWHSDWAGFRYGRIKGALRVPSAFGGEFFLLKFNMKKIIMLNFEHF